MAPFKFLFFIAVLSSEALAVVGGKEVSSESPIARTTISLADVASGNVTRSFCSGVIIARNAIVSAAHCLAGKDPKTTFVLFGTHGLTTNTVRQGNQIIIPQDYRPYGDLLPTKKHNFDIALLFFDGVIPDGYQIAELVDRESTFIGKPIQIAGFGSPNAGILRECTTRVINPNFSQSEIQLEATAMCSPAGRDSGGPTFLVENGRLKLFAIHNWGWETQDGTPLYSVEAQVSYYAAWMKDILRSKP